VPRRFILRTWDVEGAMRNIGVLVAAGVVVGSLGAATMAQGCTTSTTCQDNLNCPPSTKDGSTDTPTSDHPLTDVPTDKPGMDSGDSGTDGETQDVATTDGETGPTCTVGAPPAMNGCITDASGVFVSATTGSDAGTTTGTMADPFATVSEALAKLGMATAIYVCEGAYKDQITVSGAISIYGGLTCAGGVWAYAGATAVPVTT